MVGEPIERRAEHMKILTFGEIIWDIYPEYRVIGGAAFNFAGHCVMSGHEGFILSAVGNDELGDLAVKELDSSGVRTDFVFRSNKNTGQCIVSLDCGGVPSYNVLVDTAYDNIFVTDTEKINSEHMDAFYFGTLAQRCTVSRESLEKILADCSFREIFCDLNLREGCYDEKSITNCLEHATVLKFSEEEVPKLEAYEFWRRIQDDGLIKTLFSTYRQLKTVLFTKGGDGACIYTRDGRKYDVAAVGDKVISTVGAGDAFGAVWFSRYMFGDGEKTAAEIASRVSGYVVSVVEALPRYRISDFV